MAEYNTQADAVIDLHNRGYSQDFQLFGNDLLWIQGKIFLRAGEFSIIECHRIINFPDLEILIFGVLDNFRLTKGILLHHDIINADYNHPTAVRDKTSWFADWM